MLRTVVIALVAGASCTVAACSSSEGVTVPEGSEDLPRCDVSTVAVETIGSSPDLRGCDARGVRLRLPGGSTVRVPAVGASVATGVASDPTAPTYTVINWGVAGPSAAQARRGSLHVWGTRRAVLLHSEAVYRAQDPSA